MIITFFVALFLMIIGLIVEKSDQVKGYYGAIICVITIAIVAISKL